MDSIQYTQDIANIIVRLQCMMDVHDDIHVNDLTNLPNKMMDHITLQYGEYVIVNLESMSRNKLRNKTYIYTYSSVIVTNDGNIYNTFNKETDIITNIYDNRIKKNTVKSHNGSFVHQNNVQLNNVLINFIQNIVIDDGYSSDRSWSNNNTCGVNPYNTLITMINTIIMINNRYSNMFIPQDELRNKYDLALEKIDTLQLEIDTIRNNIPDKHKCGVCEGFTTREYVVVPCGHTSICNQCMDMDMDTMTCDICHEQLSDIVKLI